ncbi:MAG TPA: DegT/DnrJ/EryC1/StrS aminotransferase family protein [Acidobacteriota bacterium]|nr:DegT/DnrJ/EryC1/StrS aminotransferase family protein [Acidobacteriota bacterium]
MDPHSFAIPFTRPALDDRDSEAVAATIASGWIAAGEKVRRFEEEFAAFIGRRHGIACHSGAAALELALRALDIGPGDEVIVPALTFSATAAAPRRLGARVVFADVRSPDDLTLAAGSVAAAFTPRTKAVIFMPYGGYAGSLADVARVCSDARVTLIEDACHAPGAKAGTRNVGTYGRMATYSFHTTKNITTAEGGMVLFDDPHLIAPMQQNRSHGVRRVPEMTADGADYTVERVAHNHRMSDMTAALGLAQLTRLEEYNRERIRLSQRYDNLLEDMPGLTRPFAQDRDNGVGHLYPVILPEGTDRRAVRLALRERAIGTSVHYVPLHREPAYRNGARALPLPVTEAVAPRLLTLPLYVGMTEIEQQTVIATLRDSLSATTDPLTAICAGTTPDCKCWRGTVRHS